MTGLNPLHTVLIVLVLSAVLLTARIARSGFKDYLIRMLFTYTLLLLIWAVSMLGAVSSLADGGFSFFSTASLITTFGLPPTALLVAFHLHSLKLPRPGTVILAYLPAVLLLVMTLVLPGGAYEASPEPCGLIPVLPAGGILVVSNLAVTLLYVPAASVLFLLTWLKPRNRRARLQSGLFLLAAATGLASTFVMSLLGLPLQYIPSVFAYLVIINISMQRFRLALEAPSFARDCLWDQVREDLILTDQKGSIVSWNSKAARRFGLEPGESRNILMLFEDDGSLEAFLSPPPGEGESALDQKLFRLAGKADGFVSLTGRRINDAWGDGLGTIFLGAGSVPFQTFQASHGITAREWEVMGLLAAGMEYREIGEKLFVSPFTVKNHVHAVYRKLGVKNRYELVPMLFP